MSKIFSNEYLLELLKECRDEAEALELLKAIGLNVDLNYLENLRNTYQIPNSSSTVLNKQQLNEVAGGKGSSVRKRRNAICVEEQSDSDVEMDCFSKNCLKNENSTSKEQIIKERKAELFPNGYEIGPFCHF